MSGLIWGIVNLKDKCVSKKDNELMMQVVKEYKIDDYKYIKADNVILGCGIQYVTDESKDEILPYREDNLIITADAIIDNRDALLKELNLNNKFRNNFSDSQYILMSYKKWGKDCTKHLLGDFTFAIWDEAKKELFCARDQIGRRTFYYLFNDCVFIFCTLINPILKIMNKKVKLNERWITDFLALADGEEVTEDEETIYEDIMQLQAAHNIVINKHNEIMKNEYWNPFLNIKSLNGLTDEEYIRRFIKIYNQAVKCRIRGTNEIGLMISGGLDSSSIAAEAVKFLKEEGRILKTFTSVPMKEFEREDTKTLTFNEKKDVEKIKEFVGNMETHFCDFRGKNSVENIDELIDIYEEPYKVMESSYYVDGIVRDASENGCRVLLTGQYGNVTISQGDFYTKAVTLIRNKKFIDLIKEINSMHKICDVSRKETTKKFIRAAIPYKIRLKRFYKENSSYDMFENSSINMDLIKKWNVEKRFKSQRLNSPVDIEYDFEENKLLTVDKKINSRVCMNFTKLGLKYGLIIRDPSADVRIIEFCLSIPMNMYVDENMDRKLIRLSMNNLIPDSIRMSINNIGIQSSDWIDRIKLIWNKIYKDIYEVINNPQVNKFININKVNLILENLKNGINEENEKNLITLLEALIFSKFINKYILSLK